jgi:hypothetical protein
VTDFETYKTYLAFKNHFTKKDYDYFKYCGRSRASISSFHKRKDRYFFERLSRQKNDDEIKAYFVANFVECDDPDRLWIGEIIRSGEDTYTNWMKRSQSLFYLFKTEIEVFMRKDNFEELFDCKTGNHPEILKKHLQKAISIETITILDLILEFTKKFDKKLTDPVWEFISLRIQKYKPFINIDVEKYKEVLKEIVL